MSRANKQVLSANPVSKSTPNGARSQVAVEKATTDYADFTDLECHSAPIGYNLPYRIGRYLGMGR